MIDILIQQLPIKAFIPVKMMRYVKLHSNTYDKNNPFESINNLNVDDINFKSLRGMVFFRLYKNEKKEQTVRIMVNKLSLYDIENKLIIKSYDNIIEGVIEELSQKLILKGKVIVTHNNNTIVCPAKFSVQHSHANFYEMSMAILSKPTNELIYGFTLFEKSNEDNNFSKALNNL